MLIAHRIALDLTNKQATYMARAAGTARFAYNWALAEWKRQYEAWKLDNSQPKPSQMSLRRQLNSIKREQFPWMLEVTKNAPQMAIIQLGLAFQNFFAGRAKYPQFRKKGVHEQRMHMRILVNPATENARYTAKECGTNPASRYALIPANQLVAVGRYI